MYKLIQLPEYNIIVSDEEIKEEDFVYDKEAKYIRQLFNKHNETDFDIKVIAGYNNLPSINYSMLLEEDCKKIGWIDINNIYVTYCKNNPSDKVVYNHFVDVFKTAQSLNKKKFTLEDMRNCFMASKEFANGVDAYTPLKDVVPKYSFNSYMESLSQLKIFDIEIETETIHADRAPNGWETLPKITNNSIKITKIC